MDKTKKVWFVEINRNDDPSKFIFCDTPEETIEEATKHPNAIAWEKSYFKDGSIGYKRYFTLTNSWEHQ